MNPCDKIVARIVKLFKLGSAAAKTTEAETLAAITKAKALMRGGGGSRGGLGGVGSHHGTGKSGSDQGDQQFLHFYRHNLGGEFTGDYLLERHIMGADLRQAYNLLFCAGSFEPPRNAH